MKKARILMAMLVLLGVASLAEAQIVVSQTTVSTTRVYEKSGREKGLVYRPEINFGIYNWYHPNFGFQLNNSLVYQFNPYFCLGGGMFYDDFFASGCYSLGLYANARVYFLDRKVSPFFDAKLGLGLLTIGNGLRMNATIGVQYKKWDFGASIGAETFNHDLEAILSLSLAYNIQFKKK